MYGSGGVVGSAGAGAGGAVVLAMTGVNLVLPLVFAITLILAGLLAVRGAHVRRAS